MVMLCWSPFSLFWHLPSFVTVYDFWEKGSEVGACADEQQNDHQNALEVEYPSLRCEDG